MRYCNAIVELGLTEKPRKLHIAALTPLKSQCRSHVLQAYVTRNLQLLTGLHVHRPSLEIDRVE